MAAKRRKQSKTGGGGSSTIAPNEPKKFRVVVIDDHAVVRQGLAELINDQPDLMACGEAQSPPEALKVIADAKPNAAVVDITLAGGDGIELCRQIHEQWPSIAILVLSMHEESLYAERVLRAGAMGYVMKQEPQETVMAAIRRVLKGETYLSDRVAAKLLRSFTGNRSSTDTAPLERLSDRELQIFRLIGEGRSVKDIADTLFLSPKTIETHKEHIKQKLNLESSNDLLRYAIEARMTEKK
jgi:DNA-binding NarL/FixJ family response regulator